MRKFAFIGHPITLDHLYNLSGAWRYILQNLPPYTLKELLMKLPPYKYNVMRVRSKTNKECIGYGIILPLLPAQFALLGEDKCVEKVLTAVKLAKNLGAEMVALGGFTSVVGNEGEYVSKKANIAITSGNTFPAYLSLVGIEKACKEMDVDIYKSIATVMGSTGDIGSICTKILSKKVKKIYVVARNEKKTNEFADFIRQYGKAEVIIPREINDAVIDSDIILTATTSTTSLIDPLKLKPGAIVCDVAVPANVTRDVVNVRKDVLVFEGGLTKLPNVENITDPTFHRAMLGHNCIFGCLGEVVLLALEERFESFSLGRGNITENKINEIGEIAEKHGFGVSDFFCGHKIFTQDDLVNIKLNAKRVSLLNAEK